MSGECPACGSSDRTLDEKYREAVQYNNQNWMVDPQKIDKRFDVVFNGDYEHKSEAYDTFRKNIQKYLKVLRKCEREYIKERQWNQKMSRKPD